MKIIKVDAIDSTNTFLKEALRNKTLHAPVCVWAKKQTNGRGQRGAKWFSQSGVNLTFSVCYPASNNMQNTPFIINMITTISIHKVLTSYKLANLKIKWPNDILSANKKIGGILIENSYQNGVLSEIVIGIGLNVNQENFENLPKASSIKNIIGISLSLEELLHKLLLTLSSNFSAYHAKDFKTIKNEFEELLFRIKKPSTFSAKGLNFTGIIQGITDCGKLCILEEDNILNEYDLKQIQLKY